MKAKEFDIKKRDPNWRAMQDIRRSGAGGQHKDKKKAAKQGKVKHKGQMAEGDYPDGSSLKTPSPEEWQKEYEKAKMAVKKAKTQQEYEAASDRAGRIKDLLASKGIKVGPVLGKEGVSEGDEPDEEYLDKVISDLHKDALGFRPDQEFGREWMSSSFEEKLEIYNNLLKSLHSDMNEASDFGEPREILENVLQTLEREVEWPLTDVMDPREVRQLLAPIVKAVNDKMMSMEEGWNDQDDWGSMSHREFKRRELEHELGHEDEMANYAVLINNKKWKVFGNKRAAEKAAMTIQQKYGKDTRVVQTMERPS